MIRIWNEFHKFHNQTVKISSKNHISPCTRNNIFFNLIFFSTRAVAVGGAVSTAHNKRWLSRNQMTTFMERLDGLHLRIHESYESASEAILRFRHQMNVLQFSKPKNKLKNNL